jgi:hypothetical protein
MPNSRLIRMPAPQPLWPPSRQKMRGRSSVRLPSPRQRASERLDGCSGGGPANCGPAKNRMVAAHRPPMGIPACLLGLLRRAPPTGSTPPWRPVRRRRGRRTRTGRSLSSTHRGSTDRSPRAPMTATPPRTARRPSSAPICTLLLGQSTSNASTAGGSRARDSGRASHGKPGTTCPSCRWEPQMVRSRYAERTHSLSDIAASGSRPRFEPTVLGSTRRTGRTRRRSKFGAVRSLQRS